MFTDSINKQIGDASFSKTYGFGTTKDTPDRLRIKTHLQYVHDQLQQQASQDTSPSCSRNRDTNLQFLQEYIDRNLFPKNDEIRKDTSQKRCPIFIDNEGTHCAVAYLMKQTDSEGLADKIDAQFHSCYLDQMDISAFPEFENWIKSSGFSAQELAMIQPTYEFLRRRPVAKPGIHCPGNHNLTRFKTDRDGFTCDHCGFEIKKNSTVYGCRKCDFDVCAVCYTPPPSNPRTHCPAGHNLNRFKTNRDGFICDSCGLVIPKNTLAYGCRKCDFDVCDRCHKPAPSNRGTQCPGGHNLNRFKTNRTGFACDSCGSAIGKNSIAYGCRKCNFDVCDRCYKPARPEPIDPGCFPEPHPPPLWLCAGCGFVNLGKDDRCQTCEKGRGDSKPIPEPEPVPADVWICDLCGFKNGGGNGVCQQCTFGAKPSGDGNKPKPEPTWRCDFCTKQNEYRFKTCKKCQHGKRPSEIEFPQPQPGSKDDAKTDEDDLILVWLTEGMENGELNKYGDPPTINYLGGTPLFDEREGQSISLLTYIKKRGYFKESKPWMDD